MLVFRYYENTYTLHSENAFNRALITKPKIESISRVLNESGELNHNVCSTKSKYVSHFAFQ